MLQIKRKIDHNYIYERLPHGSGIDAKWIIEEKDKYFRCSNSFHCMDENGYYCGWADFSVIIFKKLKKYKIQNSAILYEVKFNLHFHGDYSQYLNKKCYLRDYLEETIHYFLNEG